MKKILLILLLLPLLISTCINKHDPTTSSPPPPPPPPALNFYDFMSNYYAKHNYNYLTDTSTRSGFDKVYDRAWYIWKNRLYPHGDCEVAGEAFADYSDDFVNGLTSVISDYSEYPLPVGQTSPAWENLGPSGIPENHPDYHSSWTTSHSGNGQIHRILFDPEYQHNNTIYAASMFGGLWRSTNNGQAWNNVNTDTTLPFTSVSDVAVSYSNSDTIYISTGYGDGGLDFSTGPNSSKINPVFTSGVYQSPDNGNTWNFISRDLISEFDSGGTTRRLIINPVTSDQLFLATSKGVFRCDSASGPSRKWEKCMMRNMTDDQWRGLEFMPNDPSVVYASGQDIYRSVNHGKKWVVLTGIGTGLDLDKFPDLKGRPFEKVERINIAMSPADPNKLYAYIECDYGDIPGVDFDYHAVFVYMMVWDKISDVNTWYKLYGRVCTNSFEAVSPSWLGIAVSPSNANLVVFGTTEVYELDVASTNLPIKLASYSESGFHPDVHDLVYEPGNSQYSKLFCAHHGGVSVREMDPKILPGIEQPWTDMSNGLEVSTLWTFDVAGVKNEFIVAGFQDCGLLTRSVVPATGHYKWEYFEPGDGYGSRFVGSEIYLIANNSFKKYIPFTLPTINIPSSSMPKDPVYTHEYVIVPKTFRVMKNPISNKYIFGFSELYEVGNTAGQYILQSDMGKTLEVDLQFTRQIIEFEIAPSDHDMIYVVTGGDTDIPLDCHLFRSTQGVINDNYALPRKRFRMINGNLLASVNQYLTQYQLPVITTLPIITGLAVNPDDANDVWVCFTGFYREVKVWNSIDGGDIWSNADPKDRLANLPVNAIYYHKSGDKRTIFIGTDAGVYAMALPKMLWGKFGNIPNVRVVELKYNHFNDKLYAATFGRGVWSVQLRAIGLP